MSGVYKLSPLPPGVRTLNNEEANLADSLVAAGKWPHPGKCQTCLGQRAFWWFAPGSRSEVVAYECPCDDQWMMYRYFSYSGVKLSYQRLGWDDLEVPDRHAAPVLGWLDKAPAMVRAGQGYILRGDRGTGKTLMASLTAKQLLADGHNVHQTSWREMLSRYSEGWRDKGSRVWFDKRLRYAEVLVLDDIGREQWQQSSGDPSESTSARAIESILRDRIASALTTIITTNLTVSEIAGLYGAWFSSLLEEVGAVYEVLGDDHRETHRHQVATEAECGLSRPVVVG